MPRLEMPIGEDGPIIEVRTWISAEHKRSLDALRLPVPAPFSMSALVDTGARITAIQRALADGMGLPVHDWIILKSSVLGDEERRVRVYALRMTFGPIEAPDPPKWRAILAAAVAVVSPGSLALIGQNLLATSRFPYDGRKRRLMMSY
jgi:hypothetical protein